MHAFTFLTLALGASHALAESSTPNKEHPAVILARSLDRRNECSDSIENACVYGTDQQACHNAVCQQSCINEISQINTCCNNSTINNDQLLVNCLDSILPSAGASIISSILSAATATSTGSPSTPHSGAATSAPKGVVVGGAGLAALSLFMAVYL